MITSQNPLGLWLGEEALERYGVEALDPTAIVLFSDNADLKVSGVEALRVLERIGVGAGHPAEIEGLLRGVAARGSFLSLVFREPGMAWLPWNPKGFSSTLSFEYLIAALSEVSKEDVSAGLRAKLEVSLRLLFWRAALDESPDKSLRFALGSLEGEEGLAESLRSAASSEADLSTAWSDVLAFLQGTKNNTEVCADEAWTEHLDPLDWNLKSSDLDSFELGVEVLARLFVGDAELVPGGAGWREALAFGAKLIALGRDGGTLAVLQMFFWRAPQAAPEVLASLSGTASVDIETLTGELIASIKHRHLAKITKPSDAGFYSRKSWRVDGVSVAKGLFKRDSEKNALFIGLHLLREVCSHSLPSKKLTASLQGLLGDIYGCEFSTKPSEDLFLLSPTRLASPADDGRDLARIFYDAILGSVMEPNLGSEEERERIFLARIAPGMGYLKVAPKVNVLDPKRADDRGPGLGLIVVFLIGMLIFLAGMGLLMVRFI